MANNKKTVVEEEVVETEVAVEEPKVETPKKVNKPKHEASELISCRSLVFGELRLIGPKTNMPYSWLNEGDSRDVEYQDLLSWKALGSRYLFEPFIIIEDDDLLEEWKSDLEPVYDKLENVSLKELFNLPQRQFVAQLKQLPAKMKMSVQNMAYSMIQDGTLYDLRKINAMDEVLGTELKLMI